MPIALFGISPQSLLKQCLHPLYRGWNLPSSIWSSLLPPWVHMSLFPQSYFPPFPCCLQPPLERPLFHEGYWSLQDSSQYTLFSEYLKAWPQAIWRWAIKHQTRVRFQKDNLIEQEPEGEAWHSEEKKKGQAEGLPGSPVALTFPTYSILLT